MTHFVKKILFFSIPIFLISCLTFFVYHAGAEQYSVKQTYQIQKQNPDILISKAYSNLGNEYAFYNIVNQKPELLILGASRVSNLKPCDFSPSAYNANINLISMEYYYIFLTALKLHNALPNTLIFGVEQWLFNADFTDENKDINSDIDLYLKTAEKPKRITKYAFQKIVSDLFKGKINLGKLCKSSHIGISARMHNSGWNLYGSPYDDDFIKFNKTSYVKEYHDASLKSISNNTGIYVWGNRISEKTSFFFLQIVDFCRNNNIELHVFLPPFSPEIYEAMIASSHYMYLPQAQLQLQAYADEYNFRFFDFTCMPDTSPRNFSDGHHGDPFVYKKITEKILETHKF